MYSPQVRRLVAELPGRGLLEGATHQARVENPICGDVIHLYFKVEEKRIVEVRFQSRGCPGAVAAASALAELCRERSVQECLELKVEELLEYLGGLPPHKLHGAEMAVEALRKALGRTEA